jgi:ABC-type transporter Mla subunit MlaD
MSTKGNNFKIGIFVLIGLFILIAALFAFGARSAWQKKTSFETYVPGDVEGLSVGSAVKYRGVQVGKVTKIGFTWTEYPGHADTPYVVVQFQIRDEILPDPVEDDAGEKLKEVVKKGLRARVKGQGITGISILSLEILDPRQNPAIEVAWEPRNYYIPSAESQFSQMLASIDKSLRSLEKLDFAELSRSLDHDLKGAGRLLDQLERVNIARLEANADGLLTDLRASNDKLQKLLDQTQSSLKGMKLDVVAGDADKLLSELRVTVSKLQPILANLDTGPFSETLVNARQATEQLNDLLRVLKQYPSGFLFGRAPLPATSVDQKRK